MGGLRQALKDPKQRKKALAALGAAGAVVVLLLVLHKKGSTEAKPEGESVTPVGTSAAALPAEGAGSSGGGSGSGTSEGQAVETLGTQLGAALSAQAAAQQGETQALEGAIQGLEGQQQAGAASTGPGVAEAAAKTGPTGTPLSTANRLVNTEASNPRKGLSYTQTTYKGQAAHAYAKAVPGGTGPKKNIVVLAKSRSPSQHPAAVAHGTVNKQAGNPRKGQTYKTVKAKGGVYHVYAGGKRVFVKNK